MTKHRNIRQLATTTLAAAVCLFADSGWKYLSLGVWSGSLDGAQDTVRDKTWW